MRNTPFLVQIYVIFFSLPSLGIRFDANEAALVAMVVNLGAYAAEIVRAGVQSVPVGQIEAGRALGLTRVQVYRLIVLFPALKAVFPALASQFILLLLGWLMASAAGLNPYADVQWFMATVIGRLILFGYTWALIHHMLGGIRHLIWDTGYGLGAVEREWLTVATLVGSVGLTVVIWLVAYLMGGLR